jgi:hypothetical protein
MTVMRVSPAPGLHPESAPHLEPGRHPEPEPHPDPGFYPEPEPHLGEDVA